MHHPWLGDRRKARWILTMRGVLIGSMLWPVFVALTFVGVAIYVESPLWKPKPVRVVRVRRVVVRRWSPGSQAR